MRKRNYSIRFFKRLANAYGREREVCQFSIQLQASSAANAIEKGKEAFRKDRGTRDWSSFADMYELSEVDR